MIGYDLTADDPLTLVSYVALGLLGPEALVENLVVGQPLPEMPLSLEVYR